MKSEYFDGQKYFTDLANANKQVASDGYRVGQCSGVGGVEEVINNFRKTANFVLVDSTTNGTMLQNRAGGIFNRRTFTIFIIKHYKSGDMQDYEAKMKEVRELYLQFLSRMLHDSVGLALREVYVRMGEVYYREPGPYAFNGGAGVFFTFPIDEPTDIIYDNEQWND